MIFRYFIKIGIIGCICNDKFEKKEQFLSSTQIGIKNNYTFHHAILIPFVLDDNADDDASRYYHDADTNFYDDDSKVDDNAKFFDEYIVAKKLLYYFLKIIISLQKKLYRFFYHKSV